MRLMGVLCLLALGLLLGFGPRALAPRIEASIERRIDERLTGAQLDFALAQARGRDVVLSGYTVDPESKSQAERIAAEVRGVRRIDNRIKLATARTSAVAAAGEPRQGTWDETTPILPAPWEDPDDSDAAASPKFAHHVDYMPMIAKQPLHGVGELTSTTCQELLTELMTRGTIQFEVNSSSISGRSHKLLTQIAKTLLRCPSEALVEIGGHTDDSGPSAYNLQLSQERAEAVLDFLIDQGVSAAKVSAKGYGDARPVADNATRAGRAENRRIELTVTEGGS